jgi:zinc protease
MASRILSTRMVKQVREEAQLVYSMSAGSRAATTFPGFGLFSASATTEPSKTGPLVAKLASMYEAFAKEGPTAEELGVARKQFANTHEEQMRDPGFWSGRIGRSTYRGTSLDDIVNEPAAFQALTAEQIKATFARYYSKEKSIVVVVKPKAAADGTKPPS